MHTRALIFVASVSLKLALTLAQCTLLRFGMRLGLGCHSACGEPLNRVLARARLLKGEHFPCVSYKLMKMAMKNDLFIGG